jgi:hypothetical protein
MGALITKQMAREAFNKEYPSAQDQPSFDARGAGDSDPVWFTEKEVRIAEFYRVERERAKLLMLTDGTILWADEFEKVKDAAAASGVFVKADRESFRRAVHWCKQTGAEPLSEKKLPGRWIPVIPVYWSRVVVDSQIRIDGVITDARDPQIMINFWETAATETLAMASKAKWVMAEGQDENHQNEWATANISPRAYLTYKPLDVEGKPVGPPQRVQPEPPPAGFIEALFSARQNLSRVMGVFDPAVRGGAQHKSDKTLNAERGQSDMSNYDGYDNLIRSIKHSWRVMLSWIPSIYDTRRVTRIIGEDGKEDIITLNERQQAQTPEGQAIEKVLNDVTVGEYDVVIEAGPGYDTQRKEGMAGVIELMGTPIGEKVAATADDLILRGMDFPGSDLIADRLAAANPLSKIDEQSDVPPQAQMLIKNLQAQLQKAGQMIQGLEMDKKYRLSSEQMKQEGATQRTHMQETVKAHDVEMGAATKQHDTEVRAITSQNVAEIDGLVALLLKHIDTSHLEKEIAARDRQQAVKHAEQVGGGNGIAPSAQ